MVANKLWARGEPGWGLAPPPNLPTEQDPYRKDGTVATQDPWDTSTGLLDDFDYVVKEAWFGTNEKIGDGDRMLLTLRGDAYVDGELAEEEYELMYTIGSGWEEVGGGASVKNRTGSALFNDSTAIGRLIESFKQIPGALDVLREKGVPTDAATWEGLAFHVKRTKFGTFTPKGETEPRDINVPIATVMLDPADFGEEEAPKPKARGKSSAAKKGAAKGGTKAKGSRSRKPKEPAIRDAVIEFASEFDEHEDFVQAVFDPDEFPRAEEAEGDEELSEEILDADSELWEESRGEE